MRLAVYTDYVYVRSGDTVYAERAFSLFLARLATRFEGVTLIGRLSPAPGSSRYPLPAGARFVALPFYERLSEPVSVLGATVRSLRTFWRGLDEVDAIWLLGPHPLAILFACAAIARRRAVFLGLRSDLPVYTRWRHPGVRSFQLAAWALDAVWRLLARVRPVIVVGPELRSRYSGAADLLEIAVSLIEDSDIIDKATATSRSYEGELAMVSVGRIAEEKNPLALSEILARLDSSDPGRWRLVVCGEGPLEDALAAKLVELGVEDRAELRGYVPAEEMAAVYRSSHFLLHSSWTEGLPQVLIEAFAAGVPAVATDVGGIREAVGDAVRLVPAGDPAAAAVALQELAGSAPKRERLVARGLAYARDHTIDREVNRIATFIAGRAG